jgi:hypothetical protein
MIQGSKSGDRHGSRCWFGYIYAAFLFGIVSLKTKINIFCVA